MVLIMPGIIRKGKENFHFVFFVPLTRILMLLCEVANLLRRSGCEGQMLLRYEAQAA
jgi:hypothetical protein